MPHTRYSSNQHSSMLLAPDHPTYKVLAQPTFEYATCAWLPHIRGTHPTNAQECYLRLVTPHTRYSSNQHFSVPALVLCLLYPNVELALWPSLHRFVYHYCHQHSFYVCSILMWNSLTQEAVTAPTQKHFRKAPSKLLSHCRNPFLP